MPSWFRRAAFTFPPSSADRPSNDRPSNDRPSEIGQAMTDESLIHFEDDPSKTNSTKALSTHGKFALRNSDTVNSLDDPSFSPHR
jgi:hypothetical protein